MLGMIRRSFACRLLPAVGLLPARSLVGSRPRLPALRQQAHSGWQGGWQAHCAASAASHEAEAEPHWEELEVRLPTHCSGCGVELQQQDPDAPG